MDGQWTYAQRLACSRCNSCTHRERRPPDEGPAVPICRFIAATSFPYCGAGLGTVARKAAGSVAGRVSSGRSATLDAA